MNFYIKNLKISNFLSFFGESHIEIQPFTAIICNFDEGKNHFFKAIDFVFGGILDDYNFKEADLNNLINSVFLNNADKLEDGECYVEVTLHLIQKKTNLQMRRALENGRIKYYINGGLVSVLMYNTQLHSLKVHVNTKTLIFYDSYFHDAISGCPEDLGNIITTVLGSQFELNDWKKSKKTVKHLQELEEKLSNKEYYHTGESREIIADFIRIYDAVTEGKKSIKEELIKKLCEESNGEVEPPPSPNVNDDPLLLEAETNRKLDRISELTDNEEHLRNLKQEALRNKATLIANIHYNMIRLARDPNNFHILDAEINRLNALLNAKRNELENLEQRLGEVEEECENLSVAISNKTVIMKEIADSRNLPNLTHYGRFSDYIRYSLPYYDLLKDILGEETFKAHLIDSFEEAEHCLQNLKNHKWHNRETFIIFEKYSPDFKDLILASDERGINVEDTEKLQTFLCKLKKFGLIKSVPILVNQQRFNFEPNWEGKREDVIFVPSRIFITPENIITQRGEVEGIFEDEDELIRRINDLITAQEMKYHEINDLHQRRLALRREITDIGNDMDYLIKNMPRGEEEEEDPPVPPRSPPSETLEERQQNLEIVREEIRTMNDALENILRERRELWASSLWFKRMPRGSWIKSVNLKEKAAMYYEREMERLKNVVSQDEVDFYKSSEEFRESFIESLRRDLEHMRGRIERAKRAHKNFEEKRRNILVSLTEHCNQHLFNTFQEMLDNIIPFLDLVFDQSDNMRLMTSLNHEKAHVVDFENLNTLLKFITVLSTFLQITTFDKKPIMILDDIEKDYFPKDPIQDALSPEVLDRLLPETEKTCYDLKMRIGEYLNYFVRKNTPKPPIRQPRNPEEYVNGPCQIIFFSSRDLSLAGESLALLSRKLLPDEYITCEIPYYSNITTLRFE